jgi:hypothetical protein
MRRGEIRHPSITLNHRITLTGYDARPGVAVTNSRTYRALCGAGRRDATPRLEQPIRSQSSARGSRDERFSLVSRAPRSSGNAKRAFVLLAGASTRARRVARFEHWNRFMRSGVRSWRSARDRASTANNSLGSERKRQVPTRTLKPNSVQFSHTRPDTDAGRIDLRRSS